MRSRTGDNWEEKRLNDQHNRPGDEGRVYFSIVIPAYNRADVLPETIASCRAQTWRDLEIIVVDDGSSDATAEVVRGLMADEPRLRLLQKENGGPAAARNHGVDHAEGRYIAFLDSDDRFMPEKLERFADAIERSGADFLFGPVLAERGDGRFWQRPAAGPREGEPMFDYLFLRRGVALPSTVVVRTEMARRHPFLESLWFGDNDQFIADLWEAGASFQYLDEPLTLYADQYDAERLSQALVFDGESPKHRAFFHWVESKRATMSERAYLAYRARFRSRLTARSAPVTAFADITRAWRGGALSGPEALRQGVQTFFPHLYRRCSDGVARWIGSGRQRA